MDEMNPGAGWAIDGPVGTANIVFLRNVLQPVLDVHAGIGPFENDVSAHAQLSQQAIRCETPDVVYVGKIDSR
jgi:hypothetical protein